MNTVIIASYIKFLRDRKLLIYSLCGALALPELTQTYYVPARYKIKHIFFHQFVFLRCNYPVAL